MGTSFDRPSPAEQGPPPGPAWPAAWLEGRAPGEPFLCEWVVPAAPPARAAATAAGRAGLPGGAAGPPHRGRPDYPRAAPAAAAGRSDLPGVVRRRGSDPRRGGGPAVATGRAVGQRAPAGLLPQDSGP